MLVVPLSICQIRANVIVFVIMSKSAD